MTEGADLGFGRQCQTILGVDSGRLEQLLTEGATEFFDVAGQTHPVDLQQHLAGQRVSVRMQA